MGDIVIGGAEYPKCLSKSCMRRGTPVGRGLCLPCYSRARKMVEAGTATWDEIVGLGLALPGEADGGDPFTRAINEARRSKDASAGRDNQRDMEDR